MVQPWLSPQEEERDSGVHVRVTEGFGMMLMALFDGVESDTAVGADGTHRGACVDDDTVVLPLEAEMYQVY